ncbi:MAG: zinc-binding dehydrogenase [Deltaproteobacteria bacterium]|nr:zinc-binding dehydrogenase [Deltaproteobacteria bacterium]
MKGVVFLGEKQLELRDFADPTPGSGEVVIEIKASGMCGSDLKFYRAPRGAGSSALGLGGTGEAVVAGHEPCGVVVALGHGVEKTLLREGSRVMNHHYKGCGQCEHCKTGWTQLCRKGLTVYGATGNGGHARYMKAPASSMVPLPDALSFEVGAAISCGTGTAFQALRRLNLRAEDTLAVFGQGPVGLSATQFAKAMGARVLAVDISPERLALAKALGADALINPRTDNVVDALLTLTGGDGVEKSLDCSGQEEARLAAVRATRTWGVVCFVGEGNTVTLDVSQHLLRRQLTVVASWTFSTWIQAECARFVEARKIPVERLFSHRWRQDQAAEAYTLFDRQTTGKGVILF